MATIGTFTSTGNGFSGAIKTLNLNVKAKLIRVENPSDGGTALPHLLGQRRLCVARDYAESLGCSCGFLPVLAVCAPHNPMELLLAAHYLS
jgi:hypothetical protein